MNIPKKLSIATTFLIVIMLSLTPVYATLLDDAYHFTDYETAPNVIDYCEWWFFNFVQDNIQGVIQYSLWDPLGLTGDPTESLGLMYVSVFQEETMSFYFPIPWSMIVTSEVRADLIMGPNTISVVNEDTYLLQGFVADLEGNTLSWSLQYTKTAESIDGLRNFKTFPEDPNEEINWYAHMPSAAVTGVLVINGEVVPINARGYHDHNWGAWKLYHGYWNWMQTNTEDLSLVGYDFSTLATGEITVEVDGEVSTFTKQQYVLINYCWKLHPQTLTYYPTKTLISGFNGKKSLFLRITVKQTDIISRVYQDPQVAWIVFESLAQFKGRIGCTRIDSIGYREYTTSIPTPTP